MPRVPGPLLILFLLAGASRADEIVLKSGGRISCEVVEMREATVLVRLPRGTMEIQRDRIESISREAKGTYFAREAERSLKGGSAAGAVELFERALADSPGDAAARDGLVRALFARAEDLLRLFSLEEAWQASERILALLGDGEGVRGLQERIRAASEETERLACEASGLLEAGDFEGAIAGLDRWRLRAPPGDVAVGCALASARLGAGNAMLTKGDLRRALDHFRAAASFGEARKVEEILFLLRPIEVLEAMRAGDTEGARRLLDSIAVTYPDPAVPIFLRGARSHLLGRVADAVRDYSEAERVAERSAPSNRGLTYSQVRDQAAGILRSAVARPPQEGASRWREIFLDPLRRDATARHFVVYAPTDRAARDWAEAAERLFAAISRDLLGRVPEPLPIELVVHASRQGYIAADQVPPNSPWASIMLTREKTNGVTYDTLDDKGQAIVRIEVHAEDAFLLENTLPHEITHAVQRCGLAVYRRGHWLDEGLAMLEESPTSIANRLASVRRLPAIMPVPELLSLRSTPPDRSDLFYAESCAFAKFLKDRGGAAGWDRFLAAFATSPVEDALRDAYAFPTPDTAERLFLEYLYDVRR